MAGMYPDNQELDIFGEKVQWPGVDSSGKFSNGSFQNPLEKPSFIPAETINLILDNLSELITKLGGTPNNTSIDQLAKLFTVAATANAGIMRDASGRAKVAAPKADDDIARKAEVDRGKEDTLKAAKSYTDQKTPKTFFNHTIQVPGAGWYRLARFQDGRDGRGYISMTIRSGDGDLPPENMTIFASACWGGYDYKGGIVAICPYFLGNIAQFRIVSNKLGSEKYLEAFFSRGMWCNFHAEDNYYNPVIYGEAGGLPLSSNDLTVV